MLTSPEQDRLQSADCAGRPFEAVAGRIEAGYLLLCDHAANTLPEKYRQLGLPDAELERHIAYDIGARNVTLELARCLGAPALLTRYSRLLIDPNRGADDPTLVMRIADGAMVPGNAAIDDAEITARRLSYHAPYHAAISTAIGGAIRAGVPPAIFSIHSFTPVFKGVARPWHATVLWDDDPRLPLPLLRALEAGGDLVVGENVPYSGKLKGDTLYTHGTSGGLAHALIEIRQDLIADPAQARAWGQRLAEILAKIARNEDLNKLRDGPVSEQTGAIASGIGD